ncbi:MAG: glycosyltransferase family protein [bacterium]
MCQNRILFYSHDAYGMGNIRRTLAICERLTQEIPDLAILIVTGSPVIHALRIPDKVDYIKLPCLVRGKREAFSSRFWDMSLRDLMHFRSELILSAIKSFEPNLVVVDKKPVGIKREFLTALRYLKVYLPDTKIVLGLRDILDDPTTTIPIWKNNGYFEAIHDFYDQVWVYGDRNIFDAVQEYQMPDTVAQKAIFTGYIAKSPLTCDRRSVRTELGLNGGLFSLVMVGGGGDGFPIMKTYVEGIREGKKRLLESLLISGPEMPKRQRHEIEQSCSNGHPVQFREFSDEIERMLTAADVVVSMGGYNSTCEILSFRKRAVIIPRILPVAEQYIRTKRLAELGLVNMIHPEDLTPGTLLETVEKTAVQDDLLVNLTDKIDLTGLQRITDLVKGLMARVPVS